ncbi:MAG: SagB/ThcOx family dehydrogenase [Prevotella sp.]|nr:SagB/ThcOx family dehydrogenase [Prevotella sp.]
MKKLLLSLLALTTMIGTANAQESISLPQPEVQKLSMSLGDALKQRRSYRDMSDKDVDLQTVSTILWAACGISDPATGKITAPSAINMQDIKVFVCSQYGVCRYMPKENTLVPVTMTDIRSSLAAGQDFAKTAPVSLLLVSTKDNERMDNNRYGGVDAGYVSQNIYLACTALGLHTVARAMMDKDAIKKELNLADTSIILLNHPIGFGK